MPRQSGYKVSISGFLPVSKSDIRSQAEALTALADGDTASVMGMLKDVKVQQIMTSREIDDAGNPVPRAPRKPRAVNGDKKRKAA